MNGIPFEFRLMFFYIYNIQDSYTCLITFKTLIMIPFKNKWIPFKSDLSPSSSIYGQGHMGLISLLINQHVWGLNHLNYSLTAIGLLMQAPTCTRRPSDRTSQVDEDCWTILGCTEHPQIRVTSIRVRSTFENWSLSRGFQRSYFDWCFLPRLPGLKFRVMISNSWRKYEWLCGDCPNKTQASCKTFLEHWVVWDLQSWYGFLKWPGTRWASLQNLCYESFFEEQSWASEEKHLRVSSRNCPPLAWTLFQHHWNLRQEMDKSTALLSLDFNSPNDKGSKHLTLCYKETFQPIADYSALWPAHQWKTLS